MIFADQSLAWRLELNEALNMTDHTQTMARLWPDAGACVLPVGDGVAVFTGHESPVNRTVGLGISQPVEAGELERIEAFYNSRGLPAKIDLCPLADFSLFTLLALRYYLYCFWNVHIRRLIPNEDFPSHKLRITSFETDADLWVKTATQAFSTHEEMAADDLNIFSRLARITINRPYVECFMAWIGDEPVGVGSLAIRNGIASLFSAATRLPFRKQGVQSALINARLARAAAAGCDIATVITLPGNNSQRNVERAGFRIAYTKATMRQG